MTTNLQEYMDHIIETIDDLECLVYTYVRCKFFLYGGITTIPIEERVKQHIEENQPLGCNIDNRFAVNATTYKLTGNLEFDKDNIIAIENYLINSLVEAFGDRCVNSRNDDGSIAQLSGNGLNIENNNVGDKIIFYVFYGERNPQKAFI